MRHQLMLAAAAALSALAMTAQEKTAVYCGDVPGSFKQAFEGMYKTAGTHKDLTVPESGKVQLAVWAQLCKYTGKAIGEKERQELHKFIENGGIVILYGAVPTLLYRPEPKKTFDLSLGDVTLGATAYVYARNKGGIPEAGKAVFGDKAEVYNQVYANTKSNHPGLGRLTRMVALLGNPKFVELGVNRVGKGALIYTSAAPKAPEYAEALR